VARANQDGNRKISWKKTEPRTSTTKGRAMTDMTRRQP
jgi:hypothetical protein